MLHFSLFVRLHFFTPLVSSCPVLVVVGAAVQDVFESDDLLLAARAAFSRKLFVQGVGIRSRVGDSVEDGTSRW